MCSSLRAQINKHKYDTENTSNCIPREAEAESQRVKDSQIYRGEIYFVWRNSEYQQEKNDNL